jgi:hypothetical protein
MLHAVRLLSDTSIETSGIGYMYTDATLGSLFGQNVETAQIPSAEYMISSSKKDKVGWDALRVPRLSTLLW